MGTTIKTATILAALVAGTAIAGVQDQQRPERPNQRPAEFRCPVCGSPCISKAAAQHQLRQRWLRNHDQQPVRANQRDRIAGEHPGPRANAGQRFQRDGQQRALRFDIDGDGQLSKAERAARRAYRQALSQEQGGQPNRRPAPGPQVEE